jgi:hypothetical protein
MKTKQSILYFGFFMLGLCAVLYYLPSCKAIRQGKNFAKCEFRATNMDKISLAGVQIPENVQSIEQINFLDAAAILAAFSRGGEFLLNFRQNVEVKNPNQALAALNRLDWILIVDDKEITQGTNNERIEVQAQATAQMPMQFSIDLRKVINANAADAFINLVMNLAKQSNKPSQVKLKVKPYFKIAGVLVPYPGYISLSQEFKSQ